MKQPTTIGQYLIRRLDELGVKHIFGVPGDYVLGFFKAMEESPLEVINTTDEQGAGFAADAYARINGLGAVCITYSVGGLKVANATAQAFAEKSPVIVISGSPGMGERDKDPMLHHKIRGFDSQLKIFQELTVASAALEQPENACAEIERVIQAVQKYKRPGYIEIPRDMVNTPLPECMPSRKPAGIPIRALGEALHEAEGLINNARQPVILAGVELMRFGLRDKLVRLSEKTGIPVASTLLAKSVMDEMHANYIGIYEGAMGRKEVTEYVESSDVVIMLGAFMTDVNLGICTAKLERGRSVNATSERVSIRYHHFEGLNFEDFVRGLMEANIRPREVGNIPRPPKPVKVNPTKNKPVRVRYLFDRINAFIDDKTVVIADPGDAMFAAIDMILPGKGEFMSNAYYTSLGFAVPAGLGVQAANKNLRPLVLVGDGAFQMTGMELSTAVRFGLSPIVIVLNNKGYGTERPMVDGKFNDVLNWDYAGLPDILGAGRGFTVHTEDELESALQEAKANTRAFSILDVHLDPGDTSEALKRLTETLGQRARAEI